MKHSHDYKRNYLGQLVCACGDVLKRFVLTADDIGVHRGHQRKVLEILNTGGWIGRDTIVEYVGTKNFTARISNLREGGYIIECMRQGDGGGTVYRLAGKTDHSTVTPVTCPNCGHTL